mgnify:CR=1 FL=1|jgi:hypothetical protein
MDLFQNLLNKVRQGYGQADKQLGGWLPGGGTASPLTKIVSPPQVAPGRAKELERITGVKGRIVNPAKTPTLVSIFAPVVSSWGDSHYANPLSNEVGIHGYTGTGKTELERQLEIHELGHLNPADKKIYSYGGVAGRALTGLSETLGKPAPLQVAGGLALQYLDAPEEDRAERFAAKYAQQLNYASPFIDEKGQSSYGNNLRKQGEEIVQQTLDPFGLFPRAQKAVHDFRNQGLIQNFKDTTQQLKDLNAVGKTETTEGVLDPSYAAKMKQHEQLYNQLVKQGYDPFEFMK